MKFFYIALGSNLLGRGVAPPEIFSGIATFPYILIRLKGNKIDIRVRQ